MLKKGIGISIGIFLLLILLFASILIKPNKKINKLSNTVIESTQKLTTNKEMGTPEMEEKENQETKEKINIYLFWGDGCPHCEELMAFLDSLNDEYKSLYTLHTYEVWKNAENKKLMNAFSSAVNQNITGVPFLIIGSEVFVGYTTAKDESIKKAIKEEYSKENRVDYYKEIKENE